MPIREKNTNVVRALSSSEKGIFGNQADVVWSSILDVMPEGISVHSTSGEITWANRTLCNIYGRPLFELKGLSCDQLFHGDDAGCPHEQVLATGKAVHIVDVVRMFGRNLSVTVEPLLDECSEPCGFIRVMRDVTGQRQTEAQILQAERFATLGQILSGVVHDVGTPLNVISGYAEYLLMRKKPEDPGHKELSAILDQTRRIATMLGKTLDLARSREGRTGAIDIESMLAESLDLVGHHLRKAEVTAALTCRINKPLIYGEAPQLRQAFFNLLLNAGQQVGAGGRLQVVIDEPSDKPGVLGLELLGTEASGAGHDFSTYFAGFSGTQSETEPAGMGLHLARKILSEAGARISITEGGNQGMGLMIHLPVNAGNLG